MDKIEKIPIPEDVKRVLDNISHILIGLNYRETARDYKQAVEKLISLLEAEEPDKSLEEAAEEYAQLDEDGVWKDGGKYKGFIAGAEWQKSQIFKYALEGFIYQAADYYPKEIVARYDGELGMGDKVRIVVLKEEEE